MGTFFRVRNRFNEANAMKILVDYIRKQAKRPTGEGHLMRHLADYILGMAICFMMFLFLQQEKEIKMLRIAQSFSIFTANGGDQVKVNEWLKAAETNKELSLAIYKP